MKLAILESPYAGDVEANIAYAREKLGQLVRGGYAPIASHLLFAINLVEPEKTVEVQLTRGMSTRIDAGDAERVMARKWFAQGKEPHIYAARHQRRGSHQDLIYLHRFIVDAEPDEEVDHINGDRLDNRRSNLRTATHQQNSQNTQVRSDNVSGYKGVSAQGKRWRANIRINDEQTYLGVFDAPEEAARAYDAAAVQHFGRFARVNFPVPGVLDDTIPEERELGIAAGLAWRECLKLDPGPNTLSWVLSVFAAGRGWSRGMLAALASAKAEGRPYIVIDGEEPA